MQPRHHLLHRIFPDPSHSQPLSDWSHHSGFHLQSEHIFILEIHTWFFLYLCFYLTLCKLIEEKYVHYSAWGHNYFSHYLRHSGFSKLQQFAESSELSGWESWIIKEGLKTISHLSLETFIRGKSAFWVKINLCSFVEKSFCFVFSS